MATTLPMKHDGMIPEQNRGALKLAVTPDPLAGRSNLAAQLPGNAMGQADERKDEFMGALAALGGSAENGHLRSILEWNEDTYEAVRWNW
jgi:hypothetical protein